MDCGHTTCRTTKPTALFQVQTPVCGWVSATEALLVQVRKRLFVWFNVPENKWHTVSVTLRESGMLLIKVFAVANSI